MIIQEERVVEIVNLITNKNEAPCKKTLQKIVYLIKESGVDLGFGYGIHFYGPYSSELDYAVQALTLEGKLDIEYGTSHTILMKKEPEDYFQSEEKSIVDDVLNTFGEKRPSELELFATTLFAARNIRPLSSQSVLCGVKKIKGEKYSDEQIENAIEQINAFKYFDIAIK